MNKKIKGAVQRIKIIFDKHHSAACSCCAMWKQLKAKAEGRWIYSDTNRVSRPQNNNLPVQWST